MHGKARGHRLWAPVAQPSSRGPLR